jgi:hypothetical protein
MNTRRHLHLSQPAASAVAEYILNMGHDIKFYSMYGPDKETCYMDCLVKGPTEIQLNPTNFNREMEHHTKANIRLDSFISHSFDLIKSGTSHVYI